MAKNKSGPPFLIVPHGFIKDGNITCNELRVFLVLEVKGRTQSSCFPSYALLEEETGLCRPTLTKVIKSLEDKGYLTKYARKSSKGDPTSNSFDLHNPYWETGKKETIADNIDLKKSFPLISRKDIKLLLKKAGGDIAKVVGAYYYLKNQLYSKKIKSKMGFLVKAIDEGWDLKDYIPQKFQNPDKEVDFL